MNRRAFLKQSAVAVVAFGAAPRFLLRAATAAPADRRRVLVAIFQRGAADGLNIVIPFGDPERLFLNVNAPEDYRRAAPRAGRQS